MSRFRRCGSGESMDLFGEWPPVPCCICSAVVVCRNLLMIPKLAPVPGTGWGCAVCGLDPDGAIAAVCDKCVTSYADPYQVLKLACYGFPLGQDRIAVGRLVGTFQHDMTRHVGRFAED